MGSPDRCRTNSDRRQINNDEAQGDGVLVIAPDGDTIGTIRLPERCANVCFGGTRRNRVFMAASQSLYAVHVGVLGAGIA